jgi:hypothetical protein
MHRVTIEERRARLGVRHHLAEPAPSVERAAEDIVGLHSSDPVSVYLSAFARVDGFTPPDLEAALYERRSLLRMLGMRGTLFVVSREIAAIMDEACTKALAPPQRRRLIAMLEDQGIARDGARWLERVEERTLAVLHTRGEATAVELTRDVPELGAKLRFGEGKTWGGQMGVSTRVLFLLASQGLIVRGRPRGSWISGQYRWAELRTWIGAPLPTIGHAEASAALLERWLRAFGPATIIDLRWWTGWTVRQTTAALDAVGAEEVDLEGDATGYVLPGDLRPTGTPDRWVRLLPGLDPTIMGWKERDWYLGEHASMLFDRNGNAGPTVWADGSAIGGWTQKADGTVAVELLERVDRRTQTLVRQERDRLQAWLGDTRITPRFRTPVEKDLAG